MGKLHSKRLGHGTNPLAVLAHQLKDLERCGATWPERTRDLDPHQHRCKRLPGHISEHRCVCGATTGGRSYRHRRKP